jgi:hypothetical protein
MPLMREFLTNGCLGEVQLGLTPEQVTSALGPADDQSTAHRPVYLLRYGAVEFSFTNISDAQERLVRIAMYFNRPSREMPALLRPTD